MQKDQKKRERQGNIAAYITWFAIFLMFMPTGNSIISLSKYLGANMITLKEVLGCYAVAAVIWGFIAIFPANWVYIKITQR